MARRRRHPCPDAPICESCISAIYEEGFDGNEDQATDMARWLGADIADHICEARDMGDRCGCACWLHIAV